MSKTTTREIKTTKTTRKIGRTTYIVSSTYADSNQHDLVSTVARLMQVESTLISVAETAKSA
jgi:hypothetical protein